MTALSRIAAGLAVAALLPVGAVAAGPPAPVRHLATVADTAAAPADCGPGSVPEPGLQGEVPAADRESGRSAAGYHCNLTRIGGWAGQGGGIVSAAFEHCVYVGSFFPGSATGPSRGVQVLDVSDPTNPVPTVTLTEPAMLAGTWESLKVHEGRKLLVGAGVPFLTGAGSLSVYDLTDCARPRLLNPGPGTDPTQPLPIVAHEGGFSPDGRTYWSSGTAPGLLSAIDLTDPAAPRVLWQGMPGLSVHGIGVSPDGNRVHLANNFGGLTVLDSSAVQRRDPNPQVPTLSSTTWTDGFATQHAIPLRYGDRPYLFVVDEAGSGGVKIFDAADTPTLVNTVKLAVNLPANQDTALASSLGGSVFSYDAHYCSADRPVDPTALACGWLASGIRVFDIRDPVDVREIAYYNPPARTGAAATNSPQSLFSLIGVPVLNSGAILHALSTGVFDPGQAAGPRGDRVFGDQSADLCFSPPAWRGNQLWVTCSDNTFQVLEFAPGVYSAPQGQRTTIGS